MDGEIRDIDQHYIVCDGGETGRRTIGELFKSGRPVVRIGQDLQILRKWRRSGKSILASVLDRAYSLLVLGAMAPTGKLVFNPPPQTRMTPGTTLIVTGNFEDIARAKKLD